MYLYCPAVTWRHDVLFSETTDITESNGGSTSPVWIVFCFSFAVLPVFLTVCLSKATDGVKYRSVVGDVRCKYSGISALKFQPTFCLSREDFVVFFRAAAFLSHCHLLPNPFQLHFAYHPTLNTFYAELPTAATKRTAVEAVSPLLKITIIIIIIIIIITFINCNWVVTRWQWLFYMYTEYEIGY